MAVPHRGQNVGGHQVAHIRTTGVEELEALDQLGRRTRDALHNAPLKISAVGILSQVRQHNLDPQDPDIDGAVARGIVIESIKTVAKDRSIEDANLSVKPIRRIPRRGQSSRYR